MIDPGLFPSCGGVYCIQNTVNGKKYIGKSVNLHTRMQNHFCELSAGRHINKHLQYAWDKYGADAFDASIIELCEDSQLADREMYYISLYDSFGCNGYNQTKGGEGVLGRVLPEESLQRIIRAKYKSVVLLNTREVFDCINMGAEQYGISRKSVANCCNGVKKSGGLLNGERMVWVFYSDYVQMTDDDIQRRLYDSKYNRTNTRAVRLLNTGETFMSITYAADKYGVNYSTICACCNGRRSYAGKLNGEKLIWQYADTEREVVAC